MAINTKKNYRTKSKNSKSSSLLRKLTGRLKSNKKVTAVVGILVFAAIGGLFVRFSSASTGYTWNGHGLSIITGTRVKKTDGRVAVQSVPNGHGGQAVAVFVTSSVANDDTYCFSGKTTKPISYYSITYSMGGFTGPAVAKGDKPAGDFLVCGRIPGRYPGSYSGFPRKIIFNAYTSADGITAVYQAGRTGY